MTTTTAGLARQCWPLTRAPGPHREWAEGQIRSASSAPGDDEQPVAGLQDGGRRGYEAAAAADDEGQVHLGREPEFEDLYAVQPGPGGDLGLEQVGAEFFQWRGLHGYLDGLGWRDHAESPGRPGQGRALGQGEHAGDDEDEVEQAGSRQASAR